MKLNSATLITAILVTLAGCGITQQPGHESNTTPTNAAMGLAKCPSPSPVYNPLPEGVSLDSRFMVRNDRIILTENGAQRRRAALELLGDDPVKTAEKIVSQLETQGFKRSANASSDADGWTQFALTSPSKGYISVRTHDPVEKDRSHPESTGIIVVNWRITPPTQPSEPGATEA